jgi:hypothetical protein
MGWGGDGASEIEAGMGSLQATRWKDCGLIFEIVRD